MSSVIQRASKLLWTNHIGYNHYLRMALSSSTCGVLKVCGPLLEQNRDQIGLTFYKKLFAEHPGLQNIFNMSHQRTHDGQPSHQQLSLANALVAYCIHCEELEKLGPFVQRVAHKHVSFDVKPEHYPVVGGVLLATLEEVLGAETFNADVKAAVAEAYFFLADVFIGKEKELRSEVEGAPGGWSGWRRMKVVSKVKESSLHCSLVLAPEDGSELLDFQPGQYLSLRVESQEVPGGGEFSHCRNYSLSDTPREDGYRITVKREKAGTVSSYLHHSIKPGDTIEVGVPCGDFVLQPGSSCVLLGAGVGITPLLTMMKVAAKSDLQTTLIYRASDASSHPFREEIESVMSQGGVTVHWMYSDDKDEAAKYNAANLERFITDKASKVYICGPGGFITDSVKLLSDIGVANENILYEYFGPDA